MAKGTVRRIDTQYFDTAIKELSDAISIYNDAKRNVDRATQSLQDSWDGKGAKKFDSAYKRLKRELDDQGENLVAMRDDLQSILETYQNWDSQNASQISGNEIDGSGNGAGGGGGGRF